MYSSYKLNKQHDDITALMWSFPNFEPVHCSMSGSNCCFLIYIQVLQEVGKVIWYSHLFQNFPQLVVIHTVKAFSLVSEAETDDFLEFSFFFYDLMDVDNLITGSSAFSKPSIDIWKFLVHILLKPSLKDFEHYLTSMGNECNCPVVWTFFCCCSVAQSCLTLFDLMDCSMPGYSVLHYLPEFAQTHVHWVSDAIQPSHPLAPFSSCPQSFPTSRSFPVCQLFTSGGQSIGTSASALTSPSNDY